MSQYRSPMSSSFARLFLLSLFVVVIGCGQPTHPPAPSTQIVNRPISTTGCSQPAPAHPGVSTLEHLSSGGLQRVYLLHLPTGYDGRTPLPLVLYFHSAGSPTPTFLADEEHTTGWSLLADHDGFIAVYPRGAENDVQHHYRWSTGGDGDPHANDVLFVSDLLTRLQTSVCVDPQRIFATGLSSGGGMTGVLACHLAGRIAAFAPVSGAFFQPMPGGCAPQHPVALLDIHGTADNKVPYLGDGTDLPAIPDWLRAWATRDGCQQGPLPLTTQPPAVGEYWTACQGNAIIIHYRIDGGGHLWPVQKLDATGVIWRFFQQHSLSVA